MAMCCCSYYIYYEMLAITEEVTKGFEKEKRNRLKNVSILKRPAEVIMFCDSFASTERLKLKLQITVFFFIIEATVNSKSYNRRIS